MTKKVKLIIEDENNDILTVSCSKGHKFEVSTKVFDYKYGCPKCRRAIKQSIKEQEETNNILSNNKIKLEETKRSKKSTLKSIKEHNDSLNNKDKERLNKMIELEKSYDFSLFKYINTREKSTVICDKGHKYLTNYNIFVSLMARCPICHKEKFKYKKKEEFNNNLELKMNTLKNTYPEYNFSRFIYEGALKNSTVICDKGHKFESSYNRMINQGYGCKECIERRRSKAEIELFETIKKEYPSLKIKHSVRNIIKNEFTNYPIEIDIYLPEIKLGIEFNGTYWHSDELISSKTVFNTSEEYKKYKTEKCLEKDIELLHIEEETFTDAKSTVFNFIKEKINNKLELI